MALGSCKHCGAAGVAHNAIVCPRCGGEDPCPHVSRTRRIVGLGLGIPLLVVALVVLVLVGWDRGYVLVLVCACPGGVLLSWGLGSGRSMIR
jgi:hypothetical protein